MVDEYLVRRLLAECGYGAASMEVLGAGLDHAAYLVDGELVARVVSRDDGVPTARREARLLRRVAAVAPVPVPVPVLVHADGRLLAYRRLPGQALLDAPDPLRHARAVGAELGRLLAVLHAQPAEEWADVVDVDDAPPAEWLAEAREAYAEVAPVVPPSHRAAVETFLAGVPPPSGEERVLCHADLGIEHVLVDPETSRVTGVLDWSDAAMTDPARDLGRVLRDLGPVGLAAALEADGGASDAVLDRVWFYARCGLLEDVAYGVRTGREAYVRAGTAALAWLFPSPQGAGGAA